MKLRLAGTLVLALGVAALASASAYAGNGQGNGKGQDDPAAPAAVSGGADDHGNSANAPGQVKKDDPAATATAAAAQIQPAVPEAGVKPSNDTAHDTHAPASSDHDSQGTVSTVSGAGNQRRWRAKAAKKLRFDARKPLASWCEVRATHPGIRRYLQPRRFKQFATTDGVIR